MKYLVIIILPLFVQLSSNVFAQEESKATYVKKGDTVPYNGILLNSQSQAEMMAQKEFDKKKCELDNQYNLLKMRAECDLTIGKLKVDLDIANQKYDAVIKIKDEEIKRANEIAIREGNKSNYWIWWLAGGILSGVALTVGVTYAVNH